MRIFLCAALLIALGSVSWAAPKAVTVDQLRQAVAARMAAHSSDEELAQYLRTVQLTEQLTRKSLNAIVAGDNPGPKAKLELDLLADTSEFLEPPAAELPQQSAPAAASQQAILNSAVNYVAMTLKRLPNFLATRLTRSFDDTPLVVTHSGWAPPNSELHLAGTFEQEVTYRDGREASLRSKATSDKKAREGAEPPGLTSTGEFGPVLVMVLRDASKGKIEWSHWETNNAKTAAVFRYQVPQASSHYQVSFCCVQGSQGGAAFGGNLDTSASRQDDNAYFGTPAYHGTLTIDPQTGAILRVTIAPELKSEGPITRSDVEVEYGQVEIGGTTYTCPIRSVAISDAKTRLGGDLGARTVLRINEVTFTDYHRFGSSSRIVPSS